MTTVAFYTLGCKVNHYETEAIMDQFKDAGYKIVDFDRKADIYIINSCTVTNEAARKSRQYARRAKRRKRDASVVLIGCYPQVSPEEIEEIEEIDHILGNVSKENLVRLVEEAGNKKYLDKVVDHNELNTYEDLYVNEVRETTRAYIKIEEGCNQFCSYCIIPYARGPVRSRSLDSVLKEVKRLTAGGVREVVLTGIHLGAYGLEWEQEQALDRLLQKLLSIENLGRIRLSSIEVTEISDMLLKIMASSDRLCSHLHLPLQSGSNKILKQMKRPYDREKFRKTVTEIRKKIPEIALTTDVMVGFPGETEADFVRTYNFIEEIGFSRLHVFPFSARKGTPAAAMDNQINGNIKKERSQRLRRLNKQLMLSYQQQFIGDIRWVVIEEKRDHDTDLLTGFTDNYIKVLLDDSEKYRGKMLPVKLTDSVNYKNAEGVVVNVQEFSCN